MNPTTTNLQSLFEQTTVNSSAVDDYLSDFPRYRQAGIYAGVSSNALRLLSYTDGFEHEVRRYLSGRSKTLHGVFSEVRVFFHVFDPVQARAMIEYSLDAVQRTILSNEWYELMPRYEKLRGKIQTRFNS